MNSYSKKEETNSLAESQLLESYLELRAFRLIWKIDADDRIRSLEARLPTEWVSRIVSVEKELDTPLYRIFWQIHVNGNFGLGVGQVFGVGGELSPPLRSVCYEYGGKYLEEFYFDLMRFKIPEIITPSIYPLDDDQWRKRDDERTHRRKTLEATIASDQLRAEQLPNKSRLMGIHHDLVVKTLRTHTEALALPLGRKVGSPGHAVAREYLLHRLERMHLTPFRGESFELTGGVNVCL